MNYLDLAHFKYDFCLFISILYAKLGPPKVMSPTAVTVPDFPCKWALEIPKWAVTSCKR